MTRDEKSREEMTAVGGRSWGKEAGWVTDGGMERCDRQGPRAAGKLSEEERVKCEATEDGLCWGPWGHVASRGASRGASRAKEGQGQQSPL